MSRNAMLSWTCMDAIKATCYITLVFCLCSVDGNPSVTYKEMGNLGSNCPTLDSCAYQRDIPTKQQALVKDRSCYCDYSCTEYGDCCVDALWKTRGARNGLNCLQVEGIGGVYMKDSCPSSYGGPAEVRMLCKGTKVENQADPLGSMPVTDTLTGVTYKNYFCSMCNGNPDNIVMWTPKLECPLLGLVNKSGNINTEYVLNNLVTNGHAWGLYLRDESDGSLFFHDCNVYPVLPQSLESKVRLCKPHLISDCSPSWNDSEIRSLCGSYTGAKFDQNGNAYKNVHCAICNGINPTKLSCQSIDEADIFRELAFRNFAILMDVSLARGEEVGKISSCRRGEVLDPFVMKCRSVHCMPGFVRRGRRCYMRSPVQSSRFLARINRRIVTSSTTPQYQDNSRNATFHPVELISSPEAVNATFMKE